MLHKILHDFNKAISEGNDSCNSNDKEKGNYFKSDIENCDEYISDNEITESDIREGFKKKTANYPHFVDNVDNVDNAQENKLGLLSHLGCGIKTPLSLR